MPRLEADEHDAHVAPRRHDGQWPSGRPAGRATEGELFVDEQGGPRVQGTDAETPLLVEKSADGEALADAVTAAKVRQDPSPS